MLQTFTYRSPFLAVILLFGSSALAQAPIVKPGAPGQPSENLSAEKAIEIAETAYSADDVRFMRDMIPHHHQALVMSRLAPDRTNNPEILDLAARIEGSQADEIAFMQEWLAERGEEAPDPSDHDSMHTHHEMAGMATPEQLEELAGLQATDFDRLFLQRPQRREAEPSFQRLMQQAVSFSVGQWRFLSE